MWHQECLLFDVRTRLENKYSSPVYMFGRQRVHIHLDEMQYMWGWNLILAVVWKQHRTWRAWKFQLTGFKSSFLTFRQNLLRSSETAQCTCHLKIREDTNVKERVHPKLWFHTLSAHHYVDGGSGDVFLSTVASQTGGVFMLCSCKYDEFQEHVN